MSIYLISPAGHPNYGDELIAAGWLRYLAETRPETDVWLDCPNPGLATELFLGLHPRLRTTNTLWRACWEADSTDPVIVMDKVAHLMRHFGSPSYDLGIDRIRSMESIHVLGGGYLNNLWPANAGVVAAADAIRSLTGAKLYATGLSVIPVLAGTEDGDGHDLIDMLRGFDHVTVRDEPSASVLGLPLGLDDAFLAAGHELQRGFARGGADLVVCLQSDLQSEAESAQVFGRAREVVQAALAEGKTVQYVEAIPGVDRPGFDALKDLIRPEDFIPFISVWRDGLPLKQNQTWLTTRFHLHFMAAAAGNLGTAASVKEGYYDVKHGSLMNLGTGWSSTGSQEAIAAGSCSPRAAPSTFAAHLNSRMEQKRQEALTLYPQVPADVVLPGHPVAAVARLLRGLRSAVTPLPGS
ncbi:polysaccharide pyruvyl transferase family protein [Arthrobacter sp. S13_S34]|nr:polysaccharide pyruvyl transferase family protein [Arthrobacter sp. S13_S34]